MSVTTETQAQPGKAPLLVVVLQQDFNAQEVHPQCRVKSDAGRTAPKFYRPANLQQHDPVNIGIFYSSQHLNSLDIVNTDTPPNITLLLMFIF